jgi:hypothetical protein
MAAFLSASHPTALRFVAVEKFAKELLRLLLSFNCMGILTPLRFDMTGLGVCLEKHFCRVLAIGKVYRVIPDIAYGNRRRNERYL